MPKGFICDNEVVVSPLEKVGSKRCYKISYAPKYEKAIDDYIKKNKKELLFLEHDDDVAYENLNQTFSIDAKGSGVLTRFILASAAREILDDLCDKVGLKWNGTLPS